MNERLGKYELVRPLGAGGMAEVFVAVVRGAEGFTRPVAIKRVLSEHSRQPGFAEMFVNEARLAAMLRHENVVQTLDFDRDELGRLYLVMELVEGRDLDQVAAAGRLPWPVLVHVLAGVLRGLGHAHDLVVDGKPQIVVHRDVSPHNVLVSWDGAVKVSDLGIAKAVASTGATRSGAIKGKPAYMSPEQILGGDLDGRSDLFAVGVMMWELIVGRPLFAGGSLEETLARALHQPITPPRELVPDLPADLDAIAMTLLARDRDQRFQHARDAVAALEASTSASLRGRELLADLLAERFPDRAPPRGAVRPTGGVRTPVGTPVGTPV
ncbi:MAG TPA: serine/threonine-protein kinase, partial [Kofleriaceae bacterium]|nr:serine/threonine-protein kinase [Kofleriaceae bacterium]